MNQRVRIYDITIILLGLTAVASLFWGYNPSLGIVTLAVFLAGLLLYAVISRSRRFGAYWNDLAWALVILCALVGLAFLIQVIPPAVIRRVDALSGLQYWIDGYEIKPAPGVPDLAVSLIKTEWRRNSVATVLEGGLFLAAGLALAGESLRQKRWAWAAVGVMLAALLLTRSLGAWMAILAAGLVWLAFYWRPARGLLVAGGAAAMALVGFVLLRGDIQALNEIPVLGGLLGALFARPDRLEVYRNSLLLIQDYPLTGIGLGRQFEFVYSRYTLLIPFGFFTNAHNLYLEIWLQQGLLGLAAFITLAAGILVNIRWRMEGVERLRFQSTWVALLTVLIHGLFDARQYDDVLCWLPFFALLGLNARLLLTKEAKPTGSKWLAAVPPAAGALFLLAALLFLPRSAPLSAAYWADLGALDQQRAELNASLSPAQKASLLEHAQSCYDKALAAQPDNCTANHRLGLLALDARRFPAAAAYLEKARAASPDHGGISKALGLAYTFTGQLESARPLLEGLPDIIPELNYWGYTFLKESGGKPVPPELQAAGLNAYRLSLMLDPGQEDVKRFVDQESGE